MEHAVDSDQQCGICLGALEQLVMPTELTCGHKFHAECISAWRKINGFCPFCRQPIQFPDNLITAFTYFDRPDLK
jgi:hypothetical protein